MINQLTKDSQVLPAIQRQDKSELILTFLNAQDSSEKTKITYRKALKQFFNFIVISNPKNIKREDILRFKDSLKGRGLSSFSVSTYMTAVRRFFDWTDAEGIYPNVSKGIKGAKPAKGFQKDALTPNQIKQVLCSIDRSTVQGLRDYALLNLLIRTGLRTIEVVRADIGDIQQDSGEAILRIQGKGRESKDEIVLLTDDTLNPIQTYLNSIPKQTKDSPLFSSLSDRNNGGRLSTRSISRIVKNTFLNAGLNSDRLTAHSTRHTAVTLALLAGATIQEAQTMARHANINTTLIYSHNIDRIKNAPERKIDYFLNLN